MSGLPKSLPIDGSASYRGLGQRIALALPSALRESLRYFQHADLQTHGYIAGCIS